MDAPTKRCPVCGKTLPATTEFFHRSTKSKDGLRAQCKPCHSQDRRDFADRQSQPISDDCVRCPLCDKIFTSQIQPSHLSAKHGITMIEFRGMGHDPLSPNRRNKLAQHFKITEIKRNYGPDHPNYKGGHISGSGYKVISRLGKTNLYEHRVIAEQTLGRPLRVDEIVHHIDGNKLNNSPDNLQVMTAAEHNNLERKRAARHRHTIYPETIEAAHALHSLDWNIARIARALRCQPSTVKKWLTE